MNLQTSPHNHYCQHAAAFCPIDAPLHVAIDRLCGDLPRDVIVIIVIIVIRRRKINVASLVTTRKMIRQSHQIQVSVFGPLFWGILHIIACNFTTTKDVIDTKADRARRRLINWFHTTVRILPHKGTRDCVKSESEKLVSSYSKNVFTTRETFTSFCQRLCLICNCVSGGDAGNDCGGCSFSRLCDAEAGLGIKDSIEEFRARCLKKGETKVNTQTGIEDGCTEPHEQGRRLVANVSFRRTSGRRQSENAFRFDTCRDRLRLNQRHHESREGMQTNVWGPILWRFIHVVSFSVKRAEHSHRYLEWLLATGKVLPCRYCRDNFENNLIEAIRRLRWDRGGVSLEDKLKEHRLNFARLAYMLHEVVNEMLKKTSYRGTGTLSFDDGFRRLRDEYKKYRVGATPYRVVINVTETAA